MESRLGIFLGSKEFLIKFLTIAKASEFYLHVLSTGEGYHSFCQIDNLDGFAHVENEDFASISHSTGFEDEAAGFRDKHEIANDVGMGDFYRTAILDLLAEDGNNGAIAAKDIAETCRNEFGCLLMAVQGLAVDLADSLGAAHDIGRVDGFVGGDHDEFSGAVFDGKVRYDASSIDVVLDCFGRVVLHHRDVFVGCGMKDVFGTVLGEDSLHTVLLAYGGHDGLDVEVTVVSGHIEADVVHRGLSLIYEDEFDGSKLGYLSSHLTADGSCCTGDEDAFAFEHCTYGFHIDLDFLSGKKVLDLHFLELVVGEIGLAVPFFGLRHHHDFDACFNKGINECGAVGESLGLDGRDKEGFNGLLFNYINYFVVIIIDGSTKKPCAVHLLVSRYETFEFETGRILSTYTLGKGYATGKTSVDENVADVFRYTISIVEGLDDNAQGIHQASGDNKKQYGTVEVWEEYVFANAHTLLQEMEYTNDGARCSGGDG